MRRFWFLSDFTLSERLVFREVRKRAEFAETSRFTGVSFTIAGVPAAIA